jgi:hypothetical protein
MTDELDEAERFNKFHELIRRGVEGETADERPAQRRYDWGDPRRSLEAYREAQQAKKAAKPERKPASAPDSVANERERWKMAAFVVEAVGPAIDRIDSEIGAQLDQIVEQFKIERDARQRLADRVRELEIKSAQQDVEIAKRDVTIARQDIAIADLERRLATGDRVIDGKPSLKSIN